MKPALWKKFSIKQKLILIIMSVGIVAILLASTAFILYDMRVDRAEMVEELNTLAQIVGNNSTAAIVFNDKETARETLSALKAKAHISSASILVDGKLMASYRRDKTRPIHMDLQAEGYYFSKDHMVLFKDIFLNDKKIGAVYIESDLGEINLQVKKFFIAIIFISFSVSIVIFFIASGLQRSISDPILQLAQITKKVSETEDYSIEVQKRNDDEIGQLFDGFNHMMKKIQSRDLQLTHAKSDLEKRVEERTEELKESNEDLADAGVELRKTLAKIIKAYDELKETQQQLLQSERMASIGQLAAGVAHEINNPIGFVSNNMEILQKYIQDYKQVLQMIETIKQPIIDGDIDKARFIIDQLKKFEEEINLNYIINDVNGLLDHSMKGLERVKKIVLDLKTFSRQEKGEIMEQVKIEEVIDGILSIVHNELKYKVELKKEYGDTSLIRCNPQRMGQVLINLLVNASQAIEEKGEIRIKTYEQERCLIVEIADTGQGIPPENLKKIFDPFFTTKPVGQGTGLGLSVSYEIVKKHGGDIQVRSKLGEGTTFTVRLPYDHLSTETPGILIDEPN